MDGRFFAEDPEPAFAWMRRHQPVFYDEANDLWALATYAAVRAAGADPGTFSSAQGIRPMFPALPMMIDLDAPEHQRRRRLVSAGFTPRRVAALEGRARVLCDALVDRALDAGTVDFVAEVAAPLPLAMIGDLLGVAPEDRPQLLRWSEQMLRSQGDLSPEAVEGAATAFSAFEAYMAAVIADRRRSGASDDLIGVLVHAEIDGDRLDDAALVHETLLILVGGDETTRHVLSGGLLALLEHPDQLQLLRDNRSLLPCAVEEMLRWVTPIKNMARTTTRAVEVVGRPIPAGAEVLLLYPSANRDETVFDEPGTFDVRRQPNPHLAFGFGPHVCLGNQLARLELRVLFDRLLDRAAEITLAAPGPFPRRASNFISGLETLPVALRPA
jgi:cytochrome P450 family 142 subfamily A polypeptide 1